MHSYKYIKIHNTKAYSYRCNDDELVLFNVNLQLFAEGDKTEKATPKKRQEARKKGQVFQSRELTGAVVLSILFISLKVFGGYMYSELNAFLKRVLLEYAGNEQMFTPSELKRLAFDTMLVMFKVSIPVMGTALIAGLSIEFAQVGFLFTVETLGIKLSKLNPLMGLKRMFSTNSFVELLKSVIRLAIVGYTAYSYLLGETHNIYNLMNMDVINIATYIGSMSINISIRICIALIILGVFDYAYQWWQYEKSLKMTKEEIKEEYKQSEGDPQIRAKIRERQRQISMRRMMQEIPKADVVITNPTHFAVALKYDQKVSNAPIVIAKGQDYIALRIKEIAKENNVQIVENKPLARTLYQSVDIGEEIPAELYQAVAEVLAFVYNLKEGKQVG